MNRKIVLDGIEYELIPVKKEAFLGEGCLIENRSGEVVGRFTYLSKKQSEREGIPYGTPTIVLASHFVEGYRPVLKEVQNFNKMEYPDWSDGDMIGTRKEYAVVFEKVV